MKRTPLPPRRTPLPRGPWRRTRAITGARRPRRATGFDRPTLRLILDRDGHACVCCGLTADQTPLTAHHRANRGSGGSTDPAVNGPANGIACCWPCNGLMECSPSRAAEARARGWKLERWQNPATVPIVDWAGRTWLLHPDGTRSTP